MSGVLCGFAALNEESLSLTAAAGEDSGGAQQDPTESQGLAGLRSPQDSEEEDEGDEDALRDEALHLYNRALGLYGRGEYSAAAAAFGSAEAAPFLRRRRFRRRPLAAKLRFNALKYHGYALGDHLGRADEAADKLHEAARIGHAHLEEEEEEGGGDVNLQFKLGVACLRAKPMRLVPARWALQRALLLSPKHFPALDLLVSVTFKLGDLVTCVALIERALSARPDFRKGILLGNAIVDRLPEFSELCPSLKVDRGVLKGKNIELYQFQEQEPPSKPRGMVATGLGRVEKELDVECTDWEALLARLLERQEESEEMDSVPPSYVALRCKAEIEKEAETEPQEKEKESSLSNQEPSTPAAAAEAASASVSADGVWVSVQNIVQEMVDLVSHSAANAAAEEVLSGIIASVVEGSSRTVASSIVDELVGEAVSLAKKPLPPPPPPQETSSTSKRSSNRSAVASFVQEVPLDLLEKRRSSRVKGGGGGYTDAPDERLEEVTAQSLLESFIPQSLLDAASSKGGRAAALAARRKSVDNEAKNKDSKGEEEEEEDKEFPAQEKQEDDIKSFLKELSKSDDHGYRTFEDLFRSVMERLLLLSDSPWTEELKRGFVRLYDVWRRGYRLPDELGTSSSAPLDHLDLMFLADEIAAESVREEWEKGESAPEQLEDDFLHMRLLGPRLDRKQLFRTLLAQHTYYRYTKKTKKAITFGKMALSLAEDLSDSFIPPKAWAVTSTKFNREALAKNLSVLENSQNVEGVEELFQDGEYEKVAEMLSRSIDQVQPPAAAGGGAGDEAAYEEWLERYFMLIESQWQTRGYSGCLNNCAAVLSRMCYMAKPQETLNVLKTVDCCLQMTEEDGTTSEMLSRKTAASLCQTLVPIILAQINGAFTLKTTVPWLLFYQLVRAEELRDPSLSFSSPGGGLRLYPPSVELLVSAHDYLGQRSLCNEEGGRLLLLLVETLTPLARLSGLSVAEDLKRSLDQALFCLYSHPSKKSRAKHLVDHGASALALTWDKCGVLMGAVRPKQLPEFDDFKSLSVSADTEALLRRFVALVPDSLDLEGRAKRLEEYLNDRRDRSCSFPSFEGVLPESLQDLFYLLGDYNFKNSNFDVAAGMYVKDLTFNPRRLDSLVALSLSRASVVEEKVCRNQASDLDAILNESYQVLNSFRESLHVDDTNATIYIESANFAYVMSAYCSRLFKSDASDLSMDSFQRVEKRGKLFVAFARSCYDKALAILKVAKDPEAVDETWLVRFMVGKLTEKKSHLCVDASLGEYLASMENLIGQGAGVPKKIGFGPGTPDLSLELLEVYYRFHASVLKLEMRADVDVDEEMLEKLSARFKKLDSLEVFAKEEAKTVAGRKSKEEDGGDNSSTQPPTEEKDECQEPPSKKEKLDEEEEAESRPKKCLKWEEIVWRCVEALERTKTIFPHHYKALHLLSSYFMRTTSSRKDVLRARKYLMGSSSPDSAVSTTSSRSSDKEPSLFGERKTNNLFNGIWRMPVNEFERAGSFSAHVGKCVTVLFEMFRETEDHGGFLEAACLLRKAPEGERKYLFEEERKAFHVEACTAMLQIMHRKTAAFEEEEKQRLEEEKKKLDGGKNKEGEDRKEEEKSDEEKAKEKKDGEERDDYAKVRFFMDLFQALSKLKKFYPKCDQIKDMLKKLFCVIARRKNNEFSLEEVHSFALKLNQTDKSTPFRNMAKEKFQETLKELIPKPKAPVIPSLTGGTASYKLPGAATSSSSSSKASSSAASSSAVAAAAAANANAALISNMWMAAAAAAASNQLAMFNAASTIAQQAMASFSQQTAKALLAQHGGGSKQVGSSSSSSSSSSKAVAGTSKQQPKPASKPDPKPKQTVATSSAQSSSVGQKQQKPKASATSTAASSSAPPNVPRPGKTKSKPPSVPQPRPSPSSSTSQPRPSPFDVASNASRPSSTLSSASKVKQQHPLSVAALTSSSSAAKSRPPSSSPSFPQRSSTSTPPIASSMAGAKRPHQPSSIPIGSGATLTPVPRSSPSTSSSSTPPPGGVIRPKLLSSAASKPGHTKAAAPQKRPPPPPAAMPKPGPPISSAPRPSPSSAPRPSSSVPNPKKRPFPSSFATPPSSSSPASASAATSASERLKLFGASLSKALMGGSGVGSSKKAKRDSTPPQSRPSPKPLGQPQPQNSNKKPGGGSGGGGGAPEKSGDDDIICLD